jgi:hypothetical protein
MSIDLAMNIDLAGIRIPDSKLAREILELVGDIEPPLLFTIRAACTTGAPWQASVAD